LANDSIPVRVEVEFSRFAFEVVEGPQHVSVGLTPALVLGQLPLVGLDYFELLSRSPFRLLRLPLQSGAMLEVIFVNFIVQRVYFGLLVRGFAFQFGLFGFLGFRPE